MEYLVLIFLGLYAMLAFLSFILSIALRFDAYFALTP
jgi:hypothetical protein